MAKGQKLVKYSTIKHVCTLTFEKIYSSG